VTIAIQIQRLDGPFAENNGQRPVCTAGLRWTIFALITDTNDAPIRKQPRHVRAQFWGRSVGHLELSERLHPKRRRRFALLCPKGSVEGGDATVAGVHRDRQYRDMGLIGIGQ